MQGVIGKGSFGIVSKAISLEDGSIVAIKKINKKAPHINIGNIKKEIRIMKLCKHRNIGQLIDLFEDKEGICTPGIAPMKATLKRKELERYLSKF